MEYKKTNIIVHNANDFKNYVDYVSDLEQQVKKQKEAINKAIEWVEKNRYYFPSPNELLDILKEVSK